MKTSSRVLTVLVAALLLHMQPGFAAGTCDLPLFSGARQFGAGAGSQFVITADLNNDGIADLVVLNEGSGSGKGGISILLGNGDGTFQPANTGSPLLAPTWAAVADFNGDGNPDLVVYNGLNQTLMMLGNGDGTFKPASTIAFQVMAVGDFNGDGKLDLVVTGTPIGIMLGKGDGTFQNPVNSSGTSSQIPYSGAVAADFNGDGKLDVATGNVSGGVFVLLGDGAGKLSAPTTFGSNKWLAFPNQIAAVDLNGDRKLDLVALDGEGDKVTVLLGNGNGTFQTGSSYTLNSAVALTANSLLVTDLNGDGIPDMVVTHETGSLLHAVPGTISVFTGIGDGTFQTSVDYNPTGQVNYSVAAADFNGDGFPDLVFVSQSPQSAPTQVGLMFGTATGTFSTPLLYNTGVSNPIGAPQFGPQVLADFNGDGILDLAVLSNPVGANPLANGNNLLIALGNGDGTFQPPTTYQTANGALWMSVGDFNNDGKPDLVVANGFAQTVIVFLNNGDGTFQPPKSTTALLASLPVVGDFNGDGNLDVVFRGAILLGNGDGTFRASFAGVNAWAAADLNGDGKLDLVDFQNGNGSGKISVQLGNGDGTFQSAVTYPSGNAARMVAIGDVNGDGIPDVLVPALDGTVAILLGNGDGTFQAAVHYAAAVGNSVNFISLADFNGDGYLDMAVASTGDNLSAAVAVILGNGDGTFRDALFYGVAAGGPAYIALGDLNGDHLPDLVIGTTEMVTLLNTYLPGGANSACTPFPPAANWTLGSYQYP
jgi:hypothetical protein